MSVSSTLTIEPREMEYLVETLGAIGEQPGGGIIRHVYDQAWVDARRKLAEFQKYKDLKERLKEIYGQKRLTSGKQVRPDADLPIKP